MDLHKRMFGDVWRWAGKFRTTERNLGIHYYEIPVAVRHLLEDSKTWIQHKTYPPDEMSGSITAWYRFIHSRMGTVATPA